MKMISTAVLTLLLLLGFVGTASAGLVVPGYCPADTGPAPGALLANEEKDKKKEGEGEEEPDCE